MKNFILKNPALTALLAAGAIGIIYSRLARWLPQIDNDQFRLVMNFVACGAAMLIFNRLQKAASRVE